MSSWSDGGDRVRDVFHEGQYCGHTEEDLGQEGGLEVTFGAKYQVDNHAHSCQPWQKEGPNKQPHNSTVNRITTCV